MIRIAIPVFAFILAGAAGFMTSLLRHDGEEGLVSSGGTGTDAQSSRTVRRSAGALAPRTEELIPAAVAEKLEGEADTKRVTRGDGVIAGRVMTSEGKPIANALVRAEVGDVPADDSAKERRRGLSAAKDESLDRLIRRAVQGRALAKASRVETRTDANGDYSLRTLDPRDTYIVSAWTEGVALICADHGFSAYASPGATVDFIAIKLAKLPVEVRLDDGTVPELCRLSYSKEDGNLYDWAPWSPERKEIEVPYGAIVLSAEIDGRTDIEAQPVHLEVPVTDPGALPVKIAFKKRQRIRGRLLYPEGEPPAQMQVVAVPARAGQVLDRETFQNAQWQTSTQDRDPNFSFDEVPKGRYVVACLAVNEVVAQAEVEVKDGTAWVELKMPALKASDFVVVKVLDPKGAPVTTANVSDTRGENGISRDDGTYWMSRKNRNDPNGTAKGDDRAVLTVWVTEFGNKSVPYAPMSATEITVQFDAAGTLVVEVPEAASGRYENRAYVMLSRKSDDGDDDEGMRRKRRWGWGRGGDVSSSEAKEGRWTFTNLQPGPYTAILSLASTNGGTNIVARQPVNVISGQNRVAMAIPALSSATVQLVGAKGGRSIYAMRRGAEGGSWFNAELDSEGRATFENLTPGSYVVQTSEDENGETTSVVFTAPVSGVVRAEPKPANAVELVGSEADGLEALGLKAGDVIYGAGAKEWQANPSRALNAIGSTGGEVKLKIIRGGAPIEVAVDAKKFQMARWQSTLRSVVRGGEGK